MTIGERIKKRRTELGLSVDDIAEKLGKGRATVYRYENGDIEKLPTTVLEPLAIVLKTTPAYLMGWEDNNENNLCSELSKLIMEVCDEYDFWNEYKYFFNDNCVIDASTLGGHHYVYNGFPKMKLGMKKEYLNYKLQQVKNSINNNGELRYKVKMYIRNKKANK